MRRFFFSLLFLLLGLVASATLDGLPRWLTLARIERMEFLYLRWVNVVLDILFAVIVIFIAWWITIKNKPGKALSVLFVLFGLAMLILGSMAIYALPKDILNQIHLPGFFLQFYFLVCAPNNIYFLSYSGVTVWIGISGLVKLQPYSPKKNFSLFMVMVGVILSYGLDLIHQYAGRQAGMARAQFLLIFPFESLLFALIIIGVAGLLLVIDKPTRITLAFSMILGIGLLFYKSPLLFDFPSYLTPKWYGRQLMLSVCSPFSFTVTYGGLIATLALLGLFRKRDLSNISKTTIN